MESTENKTAIVNDLIQINNDRIVGYDKAIKELKEEDADLQELFESMIDESQIIKEDLEDQTGFDEANADHEQTTTSGKLYRAWMDVKAVFTGHDRKAVLSNCHAGEDAAQHAYEDALNEQDLTPELRELISGQQATLKRSHDKIKMLLESEE